MLADTNVSRRHAEVRRAEDGGGGHVVVDLGSTNGTKVNGVGIRSHRLQHGDEITVGQHPAAVRGPIARCRIPSSTILKLIFLGLLYLFFLRVLRAVWAELREPKTVQVAAVPAGRPRPGPRRARARRRTRPRAKPTGWS